MALIFYAPLTSTVESFDAAQANGSSVDPRGLAAPIPGRIEIGTAPDGAACLCVTLDPADALTGGARRSEIDYIPEANAERWYVWEMFLPADFSPTVELCVMQVHDSPDGGESPVKFPNFAMYVQGDYLHCRVPLNTPSEATSTSRIPVGSGVPVVRGRWVECALHTNWSTASDGFLEAWYDGQVIAREWSRPAGYADAVGPYWKLGLYDFFGGGLSEARSAYYRNARLYSTGHAVADVMATRTPAALLAAAVG